MNQLNVITADRLYGQPRFSCWFVPGVLSIWGNRVTFSVWRSEHLQWKRQSVNLETPSLPGTRRDPSKSEAMQLLQKLVCLRKFHKTIPIYCYLGLSFCANGNFSIQSEYWSKNVDAVCLQQKVFFTSQNYQLILVAKNFLTHCSNLFLVCNHVTRRPCWGSKQKNISSTNLHENRV